MADGRSRPAEHGPSPTRTSDVLDSKPGATRREDEVAGPAKESKEQSVRLLLNSGNGGKPKDAANALPLLTKVTFDRHRRPYAMWLRFGKPHTTLVPAPGRLVECYAPGQVFGLARSVSHSDGDARSSFEVLECAWPGQSVSLLPEIAPGAHVLLSAKGWGTVSRIFALIDALEALGVDPCCLAPTFWTEIQSRLPRHRTRRSSSTSTLPTSQVDAGMRS